MNRTHFEHIAFALIVQAVIGLLTGDWWVGAAAGAFFFLGREHAQAEYRYIKANGGRRNSTPITPEIGCLNFKYWTLDSFLDFVLPTLSVVICAVVVNYINKP